MNQVFKEDHLLLRGWLNWDSEITNSSLLLEVKLLVKTDTVFIKILF